MVDQTKPGSFQEKKRGKKMKKNKIRYLILLYPRGVKKKGLKY